MTSLYVVVIFARACHFKRLSFSMVVIFKVVIFKVVIPEIWVRPWVQSLINWDYKGKKIVFARAVDWLTYIKLPQKGGFKLLWISSFAVMPMFVCWIYWFNSQCMQYEDELFNIMGYFKRKHSKFYCAYFGFHFFVVLHFESKHLCLCNNITCKPLP